MDNEAFRALVAERSKPKSTKEIAREAVEQEFRDRRSRAGGKKRRRGGAGGGGGTGGSSSDEDGGGRGAAAANDDDSDDDDDDFDRRYRDGRGGEDGGGDNDDDGNEKEPKWKRERRAKKRAKEEAEGKVRYRDRAKERREGRTNADYAGIEEAVAAAGAGASGGAGGAGGGGEDGVAVLGGAEADMTKYLGGDESRTHLVRGLDWALAQKVRREEMGIAGGGNDNNVEEGGGLGGDDANLERILQSSRAEKTDSEALRRAIQNLSSASSDRNDPQDVLAILNRLQNTAQTTSGRDIAAFLMNKTHRSSKMETTKKKKLITSNAGRTLQRTKLQFSLRCHPGDVLRSWEVPREEVSSVVEHERRRQKGSDVPFGEKLTPFDHSFLTRIKAALVPEPMPSSSGKKISDPSKKGHDARKKSKHQEGVGMGEGNKDDAGITSPVISEEKQIRAAEGNNDGDESSDEDIFGGIGKYQPSVPAASKDAAGANGNVPAAGKTKSFFEGLTSEPDSINKSKTSAPISNAHSMPTASEEKNVIDRDVFGGRPVDKGTSAVKPSDGVSMSISDYAGEYGEDIDIDFTGADDDEAAKGKKGGEDLTTTAALEYGRRSGA